MNRMKDTKQIDFMTKLMQQIETKNQSELIKITVHLVLNGK